MFRPVQNFILSIFDTAEQGYETFLKKPIFLLGDHTRKVGGSFLWLPRRQAVTVYVGLLWVIPIAIAWQFESLYLVRAGLSETELGVYRFLMNLVGLAFYFIGGYVADFWGSHRALIAFDAVSWGGYCLCMSLADNKWWCIGALFFIAVNAASGPAYLGLLTEGIDRRKSPVVFSVLQMTNMAPYALFFPILGGAWVEQAGFLEASHQMYWLFTALVTLGVFLRWRLLPRSQVFAKAPKSLWTAVKGGVVRYGAALSKFLKVPGAKELLASKVIDEWIIAVWGTYASLYYVGQLHLRESNISVIQQGATYVGMFILFLLIPNLTLRFMGKVLGMDQLLGLAGGVVLILAGTGTKNPLLACLFAAGLGAVGNALYNSINVSVWMNMMQEKDRAKLVAACSAVIRLGLATGFLGGLLYGKVSPTSLLYFMLVLRVAGFVLLRRVARTQTAKERK
ncbi:MAG TPA: hypothetical protein VHE12_11360 [bacterium]|nr:hypothetical protein [bacterium]